jgi:N-acetylmuramoyl-L-alanine amidase
VQAIGLWLALALAVLLPGAMAQAAVVLPKAGCVHSRCGAVPPGPQDQAQASAAPVITEQALPRLLLPTVAHGWHDQPPAASAIAPSVPPAPAGPRMVDVALDPGHSAIDVGARGDELAEYRLTLDLALRLRARLEAVGLTVALTREDDRPASSYDHPNAIERIRIEHEARHARVAPARVYLSLHFNGFGDPRVRGTETYFNEDNFGPESILLARTVQRHVVAALRRAGYPALDRGAKSDLWAGKPYGHFFNLRGPFPSALLEGAFLTNPIERQWLREAAALDAIADGCTAALVEVLAALR